MISIKKTYRRVFPFLLTGALLVSVLTGCSATANAPAQGGGSAAQTGTNQNSDYVLKIAYGGGLCEAPLHMAIEKGYFDQEGLKYETVKVDSAQSVDALSTKKVDASFGLLAKMIQPLENGLETKITLGVHTGCVKVLVPTGSNITSIEQLKGKKIGVPGLASSPAVVAQRALANKGIGVTAQKMEVEFIVYAQNDLALALANGAVDAIALSDPTAAILVNEGKTKAIFDSAMDDYLKNEFCCVTFLRNEIVKNYPDIAAKYTRAIQKGAKFVQENPEETARIQVEKKWTPGDPKVNAEVLKTYNYIASVSGAEAAIKRNIEDLQRIGLIKKETDAVALTKNTFVKLEGVPDSLK
ncbi:ABC transporter substrate-binding protein [Desulfitobacterium sp. Sab5]|uniref:ABC transporter substrate-binding protein n=1 Tax=Desulfitobacterium nosdiversum TaxID=3375356 RepID=UPI003CED9E6C